MPAVPQAAQNTTPIKLNPNTDTPPVPIHRPSLPKLDTTTPMVVEGGVSRFTPADIQKYGPWVINKMTTRWPHISAMTFSGWVMGWTSGNSFMFVKTANAVGLAEVYKETPDLRLKAREVFVFVEGVEYEDQAVTIYKEFKRWARSIGVDRIRNIGGASDLSGVRLRNNVAAKTDNGLMLEI